MTTRTLNTQKFKQQLDFVKNKLKIGMGFYESFNVKDKINFVRNICKIEQDRKKGFKFYYMTMTKLRDIYKIFNQEIEGEIYNDIEEPNINDFLKKMETYMNEDESKKSVEVPKHFLKKFLEMANKVKECNECMVCFEELTDKNTSVLNCGHLICKECKDKLTKKECPQCREPFYAND